MANETKRTGRCLCGAVHFEVSVPEAKYSMCHCGMCRRWSAGPFMTVHCPADAEFSNAVMRKHSWWDSWVRRAASGIFRAAALVNAEPDVHGSSLRRASFTEIRPASRSQSTRRTSKSASSCFAVCAVRRWPANRFVDSRVAPANHASLKAP